MAQRFFIRTYAGVTTEITDRIDERSIDLTMNSEEGSVALSTILIDDPNFDLDINGHWGFIVMEDEIYDDERAFYRGYVADQTFMRGRLPLGRQVQVSLADINTTWQRRVMVGASCKRPAETDVERVQWLITEAEAGFINGDDYLSTASPVNMDACDYRGQMMSSVMDDCAQASGKNWGLSYDFDPGAGYWIWYGDDGLSTYDSGILLTNILAAIDGEQAFAISEDTTLVRDPSRIFSGVYLPYDGGAVYRYNATTATLYGRRDTIAPSVNVKSSTKANARAIRYLADLNEQDVRIETSIIVRRDQVNIVRPFHRVLFQATHLPGTEDAVYARVLRRTVSYFSPTEYRLAFTLTTKLETPPAPACWLDPLMLATPSGSHGPLGGTNTDARGNLLYTTANIPYHSGYDPTVDGTLPSDTCHGFGFPVYNTLVIDGINGDAAGLGVASKIGFVFVGRGTIDLQLGFYQIGSYDYTWKINYRNAAGLTEQSSGSGEGPGSVVVETDDLPLDAITCYRVFELKFEGSESVSKGKFNGLTWTLA